MYQICQYSVQMLFQINNKWWLFINAFDPFLKAAYVSREKDIEEQWFAFIKKYVSVFLRFFEIINFLADTKYPQTCKLLQTQT